ncbi:MAG TPA: hypothetical protein VF190_00425 [Rhodothermales bacterium]
MRNSEQTRYLLRSLAIAVFVGASGCADPATPDVIRLPARIMKEDGRYVLLSESTGTRYMASRIPLSYREEGLDVYLTGRTVDSTNVDGMPEVTIEITSLSLRRE